MARRLTLREFDVLCSAFLRLPGMRDRNTRDLYVNQVSSQLGPNLMFPRYLDPHHDVWSVLQVCQDHPNGIRQLTSIVRAFHSDTTAMHDLDDLVDVLLAERILEQTEPSELRDSDVPVTIYMSDAAAHEQVESAIEQLLTAVGLQLSDRDGAERQDIIDG